MFVYVRFSVFVYRQRPCDELITRPGSPPECLRSSKSKRNGEFHGGKPRPRLGAVAPKEKSNDS
jgi:hypothetical protein